MVKNFIEKIIMDETNNKILVVTDNDDSKIVKNLLKRRIFPLTRSSILSAIDLLKHVQIKTIVLDKTHQYVDTLEFILNVRDINSDLLIFVPEHYRQYPEWKTLEKFNNIEIYDDENSIEKKIYALIKTNTAAKIKS
jgi:hypothetical protein